VLTIGRGHSSGKLQETLYTPLLMSINDGKWRRVILLPSHTTEPQAVELKNQAAEQKNRQPGVPITIYPLPNDGDENNADKCVAHFDKVLAEVIRKGFGPGQITLDYTRGTKAMSVALVLAGLGRDIARLRYIYGQRISHGVIQPGTEKIGKELAVVASARQRIRLIERFMKKGAFEAAYTLCQDEDGETKDLPEYLHRKIKAYGSAAFIYAAWDRFDYKRALHKLSTSREDVRHTSNFLPTQAMEDWLTILTKEGIKHMSHEDQASYLRFLVCDILANAERRVRDGLLEDAGVRCYRVLELVGQIRLFGHGYNSARLPDDDENVKALIRKLEKSKSNLPQRKKDGTLCLDRFQTMRFLNLLKDPLAPEIKELGSHQLIGNRNDGVLIHGFEALTSNMGTGKLDSTIHRLKSLLQNDDGGANNRLQSAQLLDFSRTN